MIVMRPTLIDFLHLCSNAREDEVAEHEAIIGPWDPEVAATRFFNSEGLKFALYTDDAHPIIAGMWTPVIEGVWHGSMVGTQAGWDEHWRAITLEVNRLMRRILDTGARRLSLTALASREKACEWYERGLKMQREGVVKSYGFDGQDAVRYARTRG